MKKGAWLWPDHRGRWDRATFFVTLAPSHQPSQLTPGEDSQAQHAQGCCLVCSCHGSQLCVLCTRSGWQGCLSPVCSQVTRTQGARPAGGSPGRGPSAKTRSTWVPSQRARQPGCVSSAAFLVAPVSEPPALPGPWPLAPAPWHSQHSGAPGSLSQGPGGSGANRSLEEQRPEPAQALNVISSSLNRIGTGAKGTGRASLREPTFQAWSCRPHFPASLGCIPAPVGEGWGRRLWQGMSPCKPLASSPWETRQGQRAVCGAVASAC